MSIEASNRPPATVGSHMVIQNDDGLKVDGVVRNVVKIGIRWLISFGTGQTIQTDEDGENGRQVYTERRRRGGRRL